MGLRKFLGDSFPSGNKKDLEVQGLERWDVEEIRRTPGFCQLPPKEQGEMISAFVNPRGDVDDSSNALFPPRPDVNRKSLNRLVGKRPYASFAVAIVGAVVVTAGIFYGVSSLVNYFSK